MNRDGWQSVLISRSSSKNNNNNNNDDSKVLKFSFQVIKKFHDMFDDSAIWVPDTFVMGSFKSFVQDAPARSFLRLNADGSVASSFR